MFSRRLADSTAKVAWQAGANWRAISRGAVFFPVQGSRYDRQRDDDFGWGGAHLEGEEFGGFPVTR